MRGVCALESLIDETCGYASRYIIHIHATRLYIVKEHLLCACGCIARAPRYGVVIMTS